MPVWRCKDIEFDLEVPIYMGILNVTPDSFSDGGKWNCVDEALQHAHDLLDDGAHIIDVGGESTRPGSEEVSEAEELSRVLPVVKALLEEGVCISVDTRHASVAKECIDAGVHIINDISGFEDAEMRELAAQSDVGLVLMHMQGKPKTMQNAPQYENVIEEVKDYMLYQASLLLDLGIEKDRICLDFGIGFGKSFEHNQALLYHLGQFSNLGFPFMLAVSRKSYIGQISHIEVPSLRDEASSLCAAAALHEGAQVFRVHNVKQTCFACEHAKRVLIALGSNMGNKLNHINTALQEIAALPGLWLQRSSSIYESEPAYKEDQDTFVNAVVLCYTTLDPHVLLENLQVIENQHNRVRLEENGPRTLDLDIVDYEGVVCNTDDLTLPHPRVLERDFVVKPILEILPECFLANKLQVKSDKVIYGHISSVLQKCI